LYKVTAALTGNCWYNQHKHNPIKCFKQSWTNRETLRQFKALGHAATHF